MSTTSKVLCANNAVGTLQGVHAASTTTFLLSGTQGDNFPEISDGNCFYLTVEDTFGNSELVKVTARTSSVLTVVRGQSGTIAREWANGTEVSLRATAELFEDKVARKELVSSMTEKLSTSGGTMTGPIEGTNNLRLLATDGTNTMEVKIMSTGVVLVGGVNLALLPYPVGSIYCSTTSTNPATLFGGGTWVRIGEGKCLIDAGTTYVAGTTGGEATHTISATELPTHNHTGQALSAGSHTHTRGTMNITGQTYGEGGGSSDYGCYQGAFYMDNSSGIRGIGSGDTDSDNRRTLFEAARSWTGATSSSGAHTHDLSINNAGGSTAMNLMQPYLAVYMWKRTA